MKLTNKKYRLAFEDISPNTIKTNRRTCPCIGRPPVVMFIKISFYPKEEVNLWWLWLRQTFWCLRHQCTLNPNLRTVRKRIARGFLTPSSISFKSIWCANTQIVISLVPAPRHHPVVPPAPVAKSKCVRLSGPIQHPYLWPIQLSFNLRCLLPRECPRGRPH